MRLINKRMKMSVLLNTAAALITRVECRLLGSGPVPGTEDTIAGLERAIDMETILNKRHERVTADRGSKKTGRESAADRATNPSIDGKEALGPTKKSPSKQTERTEAPNVGSNDPYEKGPSEKHNLTKASDQIIKNSKELIKKNTELIKNMEDNLRQSKTENVPGSPEEGAEMPDGDKKTAKAETAGAADTEQKTNSPSKQDAATSADKSVLPVHKDEKSSMQKLSDLFFRPSIRTKSEILSKEDAAVLVDNSNKIKSILGQLQKVYEATSLILAKFIDEKPDGLEPTFSTDAQKPKEVMKYQVIEVTESNK